MSEDFEDISVAETEVATAGGAEGGTDSPVASAEAMPLEIEATQVNLDPASATDITNRQVEYAEINGAPTGGSDQPITIQGKESKEDAKEEKRAQLAEALEGQEKQAERQRAWMESQHDFGGMKMSGKDLDKMMSFYGSNPQMLDKLRDRLTKSGMSKDKVDKGMKEFQEGLAIAKKEKDGTATEEDKRRLLELNKSEEFKVAALQSIQMKNEMELKTAGATTSKIGQQIEEAAVGAVATTIRSQQQASFESFSPSGIDAPQITNKYNLAATAANKNEITMPEITVAQANAIKSRAAEISSAQLTV